VRPSGGSLPGTGYYGSLPVYESDAYNFLNVTHPARNKRDFHA